MGHPPRVVLRKELLGEVLACYQCDDVAFGGGMPVGVMETGVNRVFGFYQVSEVQYAAVEQLHLQLLV